MNKTVRLSQTIYLYLWILPLYAQGIINTACAPVTDDYEHTYEATVSTPAEDGSDIRNKQLAELKQAMQEDPQFEEDFMHRVRIGGKAALYNAGQLGAIGAACGAVSLGITSTISIAIGKAIIYGINKFIPHNRITPTHKASTVVTLSIACGAVYVAAIWGIVGAYIGAVNGCVECGRDVSVFLRSRHNETIQHDQTKTLKANRAAKDWIRDHNWLTMLTLISDEPARNRLHVELDLKTDDSSAR